MKNSPFKLKILFEGKPVAKKRFQNIKELEGIIEGLKNKFR